MPTSSSPPLSTFSRQKTCYALHIASLLFFFLFTIFLCSRRALEPKLSLYSSLSPLPIWSKSIPPQDDQTNHSIEHSAYTDTAITPPPPPPPPSPPPPPPPPTNDDEEHGQTNAKNIHNAYTYKEISSNDDDVGRILRSCDLYKGKWVKDEEGHYPIYKPKSCPFVDEAFDCHTNGRPDLEYLKWHWKPDGCELPRFKSTDFLERLRGKQLMLVGDSMNRNQFESLLCLLWDGLSNKSKMYEIHGHKITKGRGYFIFKFEDYNCSVSFVRSHFLIREGIRINGQGNSNPTLAIDHIDKSAGRWKRADIIVFNTGHWWTHGKTARGKNYFKEGDHIYPSFDSVEAYRRALRTWGKWIQENIPPEKLVFYRGYSSAHFRGGDWDSGGSCHGETEPVLRGAILDNYPLKMKIVEEVIQEMNLSVVLLNVTRLTNFRKDGHPSIYGKVNNEGRVVKVKKQDCSHWCLPGVPDAWNELIYATFVVKQTSSTTLSKKQSTVARSSTEAEYKAMAYTATEITWLISLLAALHISVLTPTLAYGNVSSLALASNSVFHTRTKHIKLDYQYIREQVVAKRLSIAYLPSTEQVANLFTKSLATVQFLYLKSKLPLVLHKMSV